MREVDAVERAHAALAVDVHEALDDELSHRAQRSAGAGVDARGRRRAAQPDGGRLGDAELGQAADRPAPRRRARRARSGRRRAPRPALAMAASRSVFCSATRMQAPSAARRAIASATSRVPAGSSCAVGSSSTRCSGRMASSPAIATSCCWPPDSRRGSRSASASMRSASSGVPGSLDAPRRAAAPRFIGPKATSSKTVSATCDSCVAGFWKPMPMRSAEPMHRPGVDVLAVQRDRARGCWPPTVRGARPLATRHSVVLPASDGPGQADHLAVAAARGRCRAATGASRRRSGSRRPSSASVTARSPTTRADDERHQPSTSRPSERARSRRRVGGRPQQRAAAGSGEAARLEGHRALLDLGDRAEDDRADDRHDAAHAAPDASPRCRARAPAAPP